MSTPRILMIRTSALGDIVQTLPVLTALRHHYPSATIGWVVEAAFAPLLEGHPDLDEILTVRLRTWRRQLATAASWQEVARFIVRLHEFSPDVVLDLMGNHKAGIIAALSLSDRRLGHAYADRREPSSSIWISETVKARGRHAVDRTLSILDGLEIPDAPADFAGHRLRASDKRWTADGSRFAVLHPATGWSNKDYPVDRWAAVCGHLAQAGVVVLLAPGPGEEAIAGRIRAAGARQVETLPALEFPDLISLHRQASLVLGGDTGPVHLAHALGTPVLCVMGPTDPYRHGPYGSPGSALWVSLPCSFCHKRLDSAKACLLEIEPETVATRALQILDSDDR